MNTQGQRACRPFGDPHSAEVWVIGHDPRLQESPLEATVCFFLDLLEPGRPQAIHERGARGLAAGVMRYVRQLTGKAELGSVYATNLCNTFLERPPAPGVILIDDQTADAGASEIRATLNAARTKPKAIITMSQQVLYHLVRTNSLDSEQELQRFQKASEPSQKCKVLKLYRPRKTGAFLSVCGNRYSWSGVPVVPVLHISSARRMPARYRDPMSRAERTLRALMAG